MVKFSIVIPMYNEADKITSSLTQVVNFMNGFSDSYEVLAIDDGSSDNTVAKVEEYIKDYPQIKLFKNVHKGKGPTIWAGVMHAQGEYIYLADADLSAPISELKKLFFWISEHDFDIVIASREGVGSVRVSEPLYRHIMGRVFNLLVQLIALPGIKDSQCGFKLFKSKVAKDIFTRLHIYGPSAKEISQAYFGAFDVEVLFLARKLGYKLKEVPVAWTYVKTTRLSPFRDSLKMALDVFKVKLNDLKGFYRI